MNCSCRVLSPNVTTFGLAISLKRRVSQDFALYFFHDSYSSAPQINRLKCFFIIFLFFLLSHLEDWLSPVGCKLQRLSRWSDAHRGDCLCGVMHTVKIVSAEWCTPGRLSPRSDAHHGDYLRWVMHTAEIYSAVWCILKSFLEIWISCRHIHNTLENPTFSFSDSIFNFQSENAMLASMRLFWDPTILAPTGTILRWITSHKT